MTKILDIMAFPSWESCLIAFLCESQESSLKKWGGGAETIPHKVCGKELSVLGACTLVEEF